MAIVVSEETGRISLVEDGNLEHDIDADRLRRRLKALVTLRPGTESPRPAGYSLS